MLDQFRKGQLVQLRDQRLGWQGRYRVMSIDAQGLVRIENLDTGSKQWVRPVNIRSL